MGHYIKKGEKVEFNPTAPMQRLIDCCVDLGFTLRKNHERHNHCSLTHKVRGVKFTINQKYTPPYKGDTSQIGKYSMTITAKIKSVNDTWIVPDLYWKETLIQWEVPHNAKSIPKPCGWHGWRKPEEKEMLDLLTDIPKFRGADIKERENKNKKGKLYDPLLFDADYLQDCVIDVNGNIAAAIGHGRSMEGIGLRHFFVNVVVLGFAVINEDLYINTVDMNQPDADIWFHLAATTATSSPHILVRERSDGTFEYYPARRAGKQYRIVMDTAPVRTHIDFTKITKLDAILIEAAIQKYLESM